MNKIVLTLITLLIAFLPMHFFAKIKNKINYSQKKMTIFLWDIHDVLVEKHWRKIAFKALSYENKWQLLTHMHPRVIWDLQKFAWRHLTKGSCTDECIYMVRKNNPFLADCIKICVNYQHPIDGTIQIIKDLSWLGYTHYIGSNIGYETFQSLINEKENPHLTHIFSDFNLDNPQVVKFDPAKPLTLMRKPNTDFFHSFLQRNNIDLNNYNIIFIDNKKKNVKAAKSLGFIGIHFKNPHQLRKDLSKILRINLSRKDLYQKN